MILDDLFEASIPPHIRASDLPPAMRNRALTMKDVEKERPQGAYRFRVIPNVPGERPRDFLDQRSAEEHARAVQGRVEPIVRETADQKKGTNPRIERILKMLRARHPQAENDLEALILDFRTQQGQDRRDIGRLDTENDQEEADIERLEKILANLKKQRELAEADKTPGKIDASEDPCWKGYHMVGTKKKNGREVPNCVPGKKGATNESGKSGHGVRVQRQGADEKIVA